MGNAWPRAVALASLAALVMATGGAAAQAPEAGVTKPQAIADPPVVAAAKPPATPPKPAAVVLAPGGTAAKPATVAPAPAGSATKTPAKGVTPNAERDVTIGAINKRTGETRTFVGRPGQQFAFGNLQVQVRTCEITPPWEQKLTGAFLLIDERLAKGGSKRVYSGWMFAESPSLHPLEHPRYDIWVKSCAMRFPETGPDTVVAGRADAGSTPRRSAASSPTRSSAKKSAETPSADSN